MVIGHSSDQETATRFESTVLLHLDAAYNLARWLSRDDHSAEDIVQIAIMRAFKFFDGFRGEDARAWLLTIVRNTYFTSLRDDQRGEGEVSFDEEFHDRDGADQNSSAYNIANNPEDILAERDVKRQVTKALESLPPQFREVLVLKEIEGMSYKEIAGIVGIPLGTVMSRLARGRELLRKYLKAHAEGDIFGL